MNVNTKPTDNIALLASVDPASQSAAAHTSAYVPVQNYHSFLAMVSTGVMGASATIDFAVVQATSSGGAGSKAITGKAITQLVKASNDGNQAFINVRPEDLDQANGFTHIAITLTDGTAASLASAYLFGVAPRFSPPVDATANPAIQLGAATVVQIV